MGVFTVLVNPPVRRMVESRRKFLLPALLASFLLLTLLALKNPSRFPHLGGPVASSSPTAFDTNTIPKPMVTTNLALNGPVLGDGERYLAEISLADLQNRSLGFGKVFVINMPARTDKMDAITLAASLTGFDVDVIAGVDGSGVSNKAIPADWLEEGVNEGVIGCWRSHMNFAQKIVAQRFSSALVIEDDADWDVDLRLLIEYVALGSQTLLGTPQDEVPHSPYGDGWDVLQLGHCSSVEIEGDNRRFLMKNDRSVPPPHHRVNYDRVPETIPYGNTTRLMYFTGGGACTYAYGLSYRGAQKFLKYMSMEIYSKPVDIGIREMCQNKDIGLKCIGIFPQIFSDHKLAGGSEKDSDIGRGSGERAIRTKDYSTNLVRSTLMNVEYLIDGKLDKIESQYPDNDPHVDGPIVAEYTDVPLDRAIVT